MKQMLVLVIALGLAGPASAQESVAPVVVPPTMDEARLGWAKPPKVADLVRHYPRKAKVERLSKGMARVHCKADAVGALTCAPNEQAPDGYGFGDAAVAVMRPARVKALDGGSLAGRDFTFTVKFGDWAKPTPSAPASEG